jgi:hypothetical protein
MAKKGLGCCYSVRAIYPPPFFWALLRVMGASGGPLVLLQVKKGAFITARELSHKKLKELFHKKMILRERGLIESLNFGQALLCFLGR